MRVLEALFRLLDLLDGLQHGLEGRVDLGRLEAVLFREKPNEVFGGFTIGGGNSFTHRRVGIDYTVNLKAKNESFNCGD